MRSQINKNVILEAQRGNLEAFEEILFKYEKPVLNFIFRMVKRKEDAEDLTQETFFKLYKNIRKYNFETKFTTWLFTIATNTTYDWFRKKKHHKELLILDDPDKRRAIEKFLMPVKPLSHAKLDIISALNKIKPIYKSVLSLFYLKGFSYKEIAKIQKIPVNTVKTYVYRAKVAIKEHLI